MTFALVTDNTIQSIGRLPSSARRLDTGEWVMGLATAPPELVAATGWTEVVDTPRPADTTTTTHDYSVALVASVPTVVWTERAKTQAELDGQTQQTNRSSIETNLASDMVAIQAILDTSNATINANPAAHIKDVCRMLRRLGRFATNDLSGTS